jgi:4-hydroxybenzoate polyprenyltransferase
VRLAHTSATLLSSSSSPSPSPSPSPDDDLATFKDQNATWVDRRAPPFLVPYLKLTRLDRPIGTWLVLLPGWWGLALAAAPGSLPDPTLLALFGAGAFLMRSAGCTVNDMWDRRFDAAVARTRLRPLAAGRLSLPAAGAFLVAQLTAGLGLLLQLNAPTVLLGAAAVPLVVAYPLAKRFTYFPQAILGLAMNYGILMGVAAAASSTTAATTTGIGAGALVAGGGVAGGIGIAGALEAVRGALSGAGGATSASSPFPLALSELVDVSALASSLAPALPFYLGAVGWTVVYDTLYAHQDAKDDAKLGLKSTALWMGERTPQILTGIASCSGLLWIGGAMGASGLGVPCAVMGALSTAHMAWQALSADLNDRANLARRFTSNTAVGWGMLAGIVAGRLVG